MDLFKTLLWDTLVQAGVSRLFLIIPWLGWGPVGVLVSFIITKFADIMYEGLKMSVNLEVIAIRDERLKLAYNDAAVRLHIIAKDKGIDSKEFKDARNDHIKKLSDCVRFDISGL